MFSRPRGSVVEQLIRNEQIVGSIPTEGSIAPYSSATNEFKYKERSWQLLALILN